MTETILLYHGTSAYSATRLMAVGWAPNIAPPGSQCGNPARLYLTTHPEDAAWFAEQKEHGTVLELLVPRDLLRTDPEDSVGDTVTEEFEISKRIGMPAKFTIAEPLGPDAFSFHLPFSDLEALPEPDEAPDAPGF